MRKQQAERLCTNIFRIYIAVGTLLPLLRASKREQLRGLRTLETLGLGLVLTKGLKLVTHSKRPDSMQHDSFPSRHTLQAFCVATTSGDFRPKHALLWHMAATLIGVSRLALQRHRGRDVLCGGLLGYGLAQFELSRRRGLLLPAFAKVVKERLMHPPGREPGIETLQ